MSETAAAGSSFSLTNTFKTANHVRHWLMDLSMLGMIMAGLVASGGMTGFFDPVIGWIKMHFVGLPDLFTSMPDFVSAASNGYNQGVLYAGTDISHAAMHGMAASPDIINNAVGDAITGSGLPPASGNDYKYLLENHRK